MLATIILRLLAIFMVLFFMKGINEIVLFLLFGKFSKITCVLIKKTLSRLFELQMRKFHNVMTESENWTNFKLFI